MNKTVHFLEESFPGDPHAGWYVVTEYAPFQYRSTWFATKSDAIEYLEA